MKKILPQFIKNIYHFFQAVLANFIYGFPSKSIKVIGVTGTNGKTTTCQMISKILEEAGFKVAINSTINFKIGEREWINKTKFTTLSSFNVQKFILDAIKSRCDYLILETSSHSLNQYRVWGVEYDTAIITNVTREHFDYHKTMDKYRRAKFRMFKKAKTAIVNLEMENPEEYFNCGAKEKYGYTTQVQSSRLKIKKDSLEIKVVAAENIESGTQNTKYKIQNTEFVLSLPGLFNIENALAAVCAGLSQGINLETSSKALKKIKNIPGRMECVSNDKEFNIIIDYAVTPDSLEKIYSLVKQMNVGENKIISIFGSCGERDRGKRPIMGEIVSKFADYIILTNEDPYGEDPRRIINEVASGVKNKEENINFWKILDRREAIKKALRLAKPGDFMVVTGKGAEETMAIGKERIPWNDKKVILEELRKL